jgi:hypothetical protein
VVADRPTRRVGTRYCRQQIERPGWLGPPTELSVASVATCVALYAGPYLTRHGFDRDGLGMSVGFELADDGHLSAAPVAIDDASPGKKAVPGVVGYLRQAANVISRRPDAIGAGPTGQQQGFEALCRFHPPHRAALLHPIPTAPRLVAHEAAMHGNGSGLVWTKPDQAR